MAHRAHVLRNPVFLAALGLLLVNDHLLKGAGLIPGWLTGKLSDLAGLIVAPVLLGVLIGARSHLARATAIGTVAIGFSILELSPAAAARYDAMLGSLGVPSRSWADPTDLIALVVLPIAWWVLQSDRPTSDRRGVMQMSQKVLLGVALFACIATTRPRPTGWVTDAWIHNVTSETIDVRIQWVRGARDCTLLGSEELALDAAVDPALFTAGATFRLDPGVMVPIDPIDAEVALGDGRPLGSGEACQIARISIDGVPETIAFWASDAAMQLAAHEELHQDEPIDEREIVIAGEAGALRLVPGANYRTSLARDLAPVVDAQCTLARGTPIAHSDLGEPSEIVATVESRTLLPDGCTDLGIEEIGGLGVDHFFVCVPPDFIPFAPGDPIHILNDGLRRLEIRMRDPVASVLVFPRLVLLRGAPNVAEDGFAAYPSMPDIECGERLPCGAYVAPLILDDVDTAFELGVPMESSTVRGHSVRALVMRAEHVVIGHDACDAGRDRSGAMIDAAVLYEPLPEVEDLEGEEP